VAKWLTFFALVVAPLLAAPATPQNPERDDPTEMTAASGGRAVVGEIVRHETGRLRLRPWNPRLPARLDVTSHAGTRYLEQRKGEIESLRLRDLVLVVSRGGRSEEEASAPKRRGKLASRKGEAPEAAARARVILRLWQARGSDVSPEDQQLARALLAGSLPLWRRGGRGGVEGLGKLSLGVVTSTRPLTLRLEDGARQFTVPEGTPVIEHPESEPDALRKGRTVMVQGEGRVAEGESVRARVIALCSKPKLRVDQQRRFILRERRYAGR
jgi:hypothetical protein